MRDEESVSAMDVWRHSLYDAVTTLILALTALVLVAGVVCAIWGLRLSRRETPSRSAIRACRRALTVWGVRRSSWLGPVHDTPVPADLALNLSRISGLQTAGTGIGMLAGLAVAAGTALLSTGDVVIRPPINPMPHFTLVLIGALAGLGIVSSVIVPRQPWLRGDVRGTVVPSPYRRSGLVWLPTALLALQAALAFALAPLLLTSHPYQSYDAGYAHLPTGLARLYALLAMLVLALGEYMTRRLVRIPRLRFTGDPTMPDDLDISWRSNTIRGMCGLTICSVEFLGNGINSIFLTFANAPAPPVAYSASYVLFGLNLLTAFVLFGVYLAQGRLRLWPRRGVATAPAISS